MGARASLRMLRLKFLIRRSSTNADKRQRARSGRKEQESVAAQKSDGSDVEKEMRRYKSAARRRRGGNGGTARNR